MTITNHVAEERWVRSMSCSVSCASQEYNDLPCKHDGSRTGTHIFLSTKTTEKIVSQRKLGLVLYAETCQISGKVTFIMSFGYSRLENVIRNFCSYIGT